jgi:hypothetical protein
MDLPERKAVVVIPMACKARIEGVLLDIFSGYTGLHYWLWFKIDSRT